MAAVLVQTSWLVAARLVAAQAVARPAARWVVRRVPRLAVWQVAVAQGMAEAAAARLR